MEEKTKILIIEDQKTFSLAMVRQLTKVGYEILTVIESGEEACEKINGLDADIILMDIIIGGEMNGIETAKIILKENDIPIIFLSGGSLALSAKDVSFDGIYGYVSKYAKLEDLNLSIEIALHKFSQDQKNKFDKYFLTEAQSIANIGHWKLDFVTNELFWSDEMYKIFHQDKNTFKPSSEAYLNFVHPEDLVALENTIYNSLENKTEFGVEHRVIIKENEIRYFNSKGKTFFSEEGAPLLSIGTVQDITSTHLSTSKLKQSESNFREIFTNSIDEVYIIEMKSLSFIEVNLAAKKKIGYSSSEFVEKTFFDITVNTYDIKEIIKRLLKERVGVEVETDIFHKTKIGNEYPVHVKMKKIRYNNSIVFLVLASDITNTKQLELERSEQSHVREITNDLLSIRHDFNDLKNFYSAILNKILELPFLEKEKKGLLFILNKNGDLKLNASKNIIKTNSILARATANEQLMLSKISEYRFYSKKTKDSKLDELERLSSFNIPITHNNEILGIYTLFSNHAEKKSKKYTYILETIGKAIGLIIGRMNERLDTIESESRFRMLTENIEEVFWLRDWKSKNILYISPSYEDIYEESCESLYLDSNSWVLKIHPDDKARIIELYSMKAIHCEYDTEFRVIMADGRVKWVHEKAFPIFENGELIKMAGNSIDITETKLIQHKLIENEEKFRAYIENSADVVTVIDLNYKITYNSPNYNHIFGYSLDDSHYKIMSLIHPTDIERLKLAFDWLTENINESLNIGYRFKHKNNEWIWVESSIKYIVKSIENQYYIINSRDVSIKKEIQNDLSVSEKRFRDLYNNNLSGLFTISIDGKIIECNNVFAKIFGFESRKNVLNLYTSDIFESSIDIVQLLKESKGVLKSAQRIVKLKNGKKIRLLENIKLIYDEFNNIVNYEGSMSDTTELYEIEIEKRMIEVIPAENPNPVMRLDYNLNIIYENDAGKKISDKYRFKQKRMILFLNKTINEYKKVANIEVRIGNRYFIFYAVNFKKQGYLNLYGTDITALENSKAAHLQLTLDLEKLVDTRTNELKETVDKLNNEVIVRKQAEDEISRSLSEKEILLNEITHRVKNNLQVISSLLSLQQNNIENIETIKMLSDTSHRIKSMALIHETLYSSNDFSQINFKNYLESLVRYISSSFDMRNIKLNLDFIDCVLSIETATSCGMILMELITNSIKYAFPNNESGAIDIIFKQLKNGTYSLIVQDNGIGLPENYDINKSETLGMQLVIGLTSQITGEIKVTCKNGTCTNVTFKNKSLI